MRQEIGAGVDAGDLSSAADLVFQKLSYRLAALVTPVGSQAMLSRALHLAQLEFPALRDVHAGPEGGFVGLDETLCELEADEADKTLFAVLTILIDLLVGFIGKELALRVVGDVSTELPLLQPGKSDGQEAAS